MKRNRQILSDLERSTKEFIIQKLGHSTQFQCRKHKRNDKILQLALLNSIELRENTHKASIYVKDTSNAALQIGQKVSILDDRWSS